MVSRARAMDQVAEFLQGGVAILVGTAGPDAVPHAVRAWGATVTDGGRALRVLLPAEPEDLWAALAVEGRIAVCFTDVATYRSVQAKGIVTALPTEPTDADTSTWERYRERFFVAVEEGSFVPRPLAERLLPTAVRPVVIEVSELFDQTPGPAAGRAIPEGRG